MAGFRKASTTRINAFPVGDGFYFKHYFDDSAVFRELAGYYNESEHRFELPTEAFPETRRFLEDEGYGLVPVTELEEFVVAKRKYTDHPDFLFRNAVLQRDSPDYNLFLMKDQSAVEQAIVNGAIPLTETNATFEP
jgi:hypothetical protein